MERNEKTGRNLGANGSATLSFSESFCPACTLGCCGQEGKCPVIPSTWKDAQVSGDSQTPINKERNYENEMRGDRSLARRGDFGRVWYVLQTAAGLPEEDILRKS
jgi:hypothetical protein